MRIIVVGGGISGAALAFLLKKHTPYEITVIEKIKIGGKAQSIKKKGYLIETGPNGFLDVKQDIINLIRESGFEDNVIESNQAAARRFIYSEGKLWELPQNPVKLLFSNFLSVKAKINILKEPFVRPNPLDETVMEFVSRRLGKEFLDKVIGPMVCGVFAGDPSYMSMYSNFPKIKEIETKYGSLIKGLISLMINKKAKASNASGGFDARLLSFKDGVGSFISYLLKGIDTIYDEIVSIEKDQNGYTLFGRRSKYKADIAVFAIPSYALSKIVEGIDNGFSKLLSEQPYAPLAVSTLGFDYIDNDISNSFGYLFNLNDIEDAIGVLFDSSIFPNRAPDNKLLVRLMVGGALRKESPFKKELFKIAVKELQRSANIFSPFSFSFSMIHTKAIPIYDMNHKHLLERLKEFEKRNKGLYITGNAFYGVGLNDCVKSAYNVVDRIKERV